MQLRMMACLPIGIGKRKKQKEREHVGAALARAEASEAWCSWGGYARLNEKTEED
jgi:hypothetical protein